MIEDHFNDFIVREFLVSNSKGEEIRTTQYQYLSWPDHSVPESTTPLIEVITNIETLNEQTRKENEAAAPFIVHCR